MKTIQKFVFLTIVLFAANTQAGRWLTRDPIEHMERDPQPAMPFNLSLGESVSS